MSDEPKIGPNRGNAGKGRPKGSSNKVTKAVKEMVIEALDEAGGVEYLLTQSRDNPTAFLTLVGKVLPLQVSGDPDAPLVHKIVREFVSPQNSNG